MNKYIYQTSISTCTCMYSNQNTESEVSSHKHTCWGACCIMDIHMLGCWDVQRKLPTNVHTHVDTHTRTHTYTHAHVHTHTYTHTHTHVHTHTYTHIHTHTYIHTHTHSHTVLFLQTSCTNFCRRITQGTHLVTVKNI